MSGPEESDVVEGNLDRDGYEVYRDVFQAHGLAKAAAKGDFKNVFGSEDEHGHVKRWQRPVLESSNDAGLWATFDAVKVFLKPKYSERSFRDEYVLRSDPGCPVQDAHADYQPDEVSTRRRRAMSCIIALQSETVLHVWKGKFNTEQWQGPPCHPSVVCVPAGGVCALPRRLSACRHGVDANSTRTAFPPAHVHGRQLAAKGSQRHVEGQHGPTPDAVHC